MCHAGPGGMSLLAIIYNFLSNHFELLLAVNFFGLIGLLVIFIAARLRYYFLGKILNSSLFYVLLVLQILLVSSTLYVVVKNWRPKPALDFTAQIVATTRWVQEDLEIFFIDENRLVSIQADGQNRRTVFEAPGRIKQYMFSPDGQWLLITTAQELFLFNCHTSQARLIDSLRLSENEGETQIKGSINKMVWARSADRFCYRLSQWTGFATMEKWFVYDLDRHQKRPIQLAGRQISELIWGVDGKTLYFPRYTELTEAKTEDQKSCKWVVYIIPYASLRPARFLTLYTSEPELPMRELHQEGVRLYLPQKQYAFGHDVPKRKTAHSAWGAEIGIDESDTLYYVSSLWWPKRLFKVPRVEDIDNIKRYQYRGGILTINDLRFLPSGRYVIMEHYFWGILIMDPRSGRVGILDNQHGNTFGWFPP